MSTWNNEAEAREQIKEMVAKYYHDFKEKITPYKEGERITYAARVFDEKRYVIRLTACRDVGDSGVLQERQYGAEVYVCDAGGLVDESANY